MTLENLKKGQMFKIISIPDPYIRAQTIRFGLGEGETALCEEVVPAGPVIIRKNLQEIVLGRGLAKQIVVELS
ncbi:MAG: ferrous iron transport protein A [Bacillota bacterium]